MKGPKRRRVWEVPVRRMGVAESILVIASYPGKAVARALNCGYDELAGKPRRTRAPADPRRWPSFVITKRKKGGSDVLPGES